MKNLIEHQKLFRMLGAPILFSRWLYTVHDDTWLINLPNQSYSRPKHFLCPAKRLFFLYCSPYSYRTSNHFITSFLYCSWYSFHSSNYGDSENYRCLLERERTATITKAIVGKAVTKDRFYNIVPAKLSSCSYLYSLNIVNQIQKK